MRKFSFKATVRARAGQVLGTYRFAEVPINQTGAVSFERMVREHSQVVTFESLDRYSAIGKKAFRFVLRAAKQPIGVQSDQLAGGRTWVYTTEEELTACLQESLAVLLDAGFPWLDMYTPGNVPNWSGAIDRHIHPLLSPFGFKPVDKVDVAVFRLEDGQRIRSINFDFQRPYVLRVSAIVVVKPSSVSAVELPSWNYQTEVELENCVLEAKEAIGRILANWFSA